MQSRMQMSKNVNNDVSMNPPISDPEIVKQSDYLQHLNRGDLVMANKGFTIQDELASVGAKFALPHFMKGKKQFTKEESEHNKKNCEPTDSC